MKRLTIHLKSVEKIVDNGKTKLFNTVSYRVKSEADVTGYLRTHEKNYSKHQISNIL